ncbi:MAG: hypothetical protein NZ749_06090 [bacterium]|nr:hypothetical protein [bacterium]
MSASRLKWLVALWGALWTWLLASWSGVSVTTSILRALTVFVMLVAVMIVLQTVMDASKSIQKPTENRPVLEEPSAPKEPQEEREAA